MPATSLELALLVDGTAVRASLSAERAILLGRAEDCTLRVDDASVSRHHAEVSLRDGIVRLRDLGSANGTWIRAHGGGSEASTHTLRAVRDAELPVGAIFHVGSVVGTLRRIDPDEARSEPVVRDPTMRAVFEQASRAAGALISVLILGETGVGKEVLARAIHDRSPRAAKPFVAVNCAALAPSLLEAELFGHEKGAFTGAIASSPGLFESADGGTIFLDEIGELPVAVQVKLLRVLEERAVTRVGARTPRAVDVRVVSATNRDLAAECTRGAFRQDLFYRLNAMSLTIPPLRARPTEIPELSSLFLARACKSLDRAPIERIAPDAMNALLRHAWPGNVRELRNVIERAVVLCEGDTITTQHLPDGLRDDAPVSTPDLKSEVARAERARVLEVLERCGGNQTKAAEMLGVSRRTLVSRLSQYGLTRPRKK